MHSKIDYSSHPVLYLDPVENNRARFRSSFEAEWTIHATGDPGEAVRFLGEEPISVLLMDTAGEWGPVAEAAGASDQRIVRLAIGSFEEQGVLAEAVSRGVIDKVVARPWSEEALRVSLRNAVDRLRLEETIASLERQVERSSRLSSLTFASAGIAHDMKTPLTSLMAGLELFERQVARLEQRDDGAALARDMRQVLMACTQSTRQLRSLVDAIRTHIQSQPPTHETFDLAQAIDAALLLSRSEIGSKATLEVEKVDGTLIRGEPSQITQALLNLLSNALQALEGQEPSKRFVRVFGGVEGGKAVLRVEDGGKGIAAEELPRVRQPFYTTREDGTGLGLAIVQEIVEGHGGELRIESEPGRGTTVSVFFPLAGA